MGCCPSLPAWPWRDDRHRMLELRIQAALREIIRHKEAHDDTQASFTRIILKFPVLRAAIASIREVFKRFDTDGSGAIDKAELRQALLALGAHLSEPDLAEMFAYANFSQRGALTFKEFVLCLCLGSVLQLFPLLKAYTGITLPLPGEGGGASDLSGRGGTARDGAGSGPTLSGRMSSGRRTVTPHPPPVAPVGGGEAPVPPPTLVSGPNPSTDTPGKVGAGDVDESGVARPAQPPAPPPPAMDEVRGGSAEGRTDGQLEGTRLYAQGLRLVRALRIILEAYVLFDRDGSGTIDREEVLAMIEEENAKQKAGAGATGPTGKRRHAEGMSGNVLLSKERWLELDIDASGEISFAEFVHAFMDWVGIEDDDEDDEGGGGGDGGDGQTDPRHREAGAGGEHAAGEVATSTASLTSPTSFRRTPDRPRSGKPSPRDAAGTGTAIPASLRPTASMTSLGHRAGNASAGEGRLPTRISSTSHMLTDAEVDAALELPLGPSLPRRHSSSVTSSRPDGDISPTPPPANDAEDHGHDAAPPRPLRDGSSRREHGGGGRKGIRAHTGHHPTHAHGRHHAGKHGVLPATAPIMAATASGGSDDTAAHSHSTSPSPPTTAGLPPSRPPSHLAVVTAVPVVDRGDGDRAGGDVSHLTHDSELATGSRGSRHMHMADEVGKTLTPTALGSITMDTARLHTGPSDDAANGAGAGAGSGVEGHALPPTASARDVTALATDAVQAASPGREADDPSIPDVADASHGMQPAATTLPGQVEA